MGVHGHANTQLTVSAILVLFRRINIGKLLNMINMSKIKYLILLVTNAANMIMDKGIKLNILDIVCHASI
jgi:hypothetical protein